MKHPYETGGIIASLVILTVVLSAGIFAQDIDNGLHDYMQTQHGGSGPSTSKIPDEYFEQEWNKYYEEILTAHEKEDCKTTTYNLQEFYACVNKP